MAGNGVQMPGPQGSGYEDGFDPIGRDMRDMAPPGGNTAGMDLPHGNAESEAGWLDGQDYRGMASQDPIPQGTHMGVFSDDGSFVGDTASSSGVHVVGQVTSNTAELSGAGALSAFNALENGSGQGGSSAGGPVQGFDSMAGLAGYSMPASMSGVQDSYTTGGSGFGDQD